MTKTCKGGKAHRGVVQKDKQVPTPCGPLDAWTPRGIKQLWFCSHHMVCMECGRVMAEEVGCPLNYDEMPQERRWR